MFDPSVQLLALSDELREKVFPKNVIKIGSFAVNDSVISGFIVAVSYTHLTLPTKRIV